VRSARALAIIAAFTAYPTFAPAPARPQAASGGAAPTQSSNWPSFRGPGAGGVADGLELPEAFSGVDGVNLAWRAEIPGMGHASPVVWGDRVYITSAVSEAPPQRYLAELPDSRESIVDRTTHRWVIMALDKRNGDVLWERTAAEGVPRTGRQRKGSFNNSTPATNGTHVVALFGSQGLFCYDSEGNMLWQVDLGVLDAGWFFDPTFQWGTASSPIIQGDQVIVQVDVFGGSFIAAFDLADGSERWHTPRDEVSSWATPTAVVTPERTEIITNGGRAIRAYDAATGEQLWMLSPSSEIAAPTPIFAGGFIFVGSGYLPTQPFYAVRPGGSGDISLEEGRRASRQVAWSMPDGGPLLATPIVVGNYLFLLSRDGTLSCFDAGTGLPLYRQEIVPAEASSSEPADPTVTDVVPVEAPKPVTFSASPVASNGKLYVASDSGDIYVIEAGPFLRLVSTNAVGEAVFATPAISDGLLLVRAQRHLFAFSLGERGGGSVAVPVVACGGGPCYFYDAVAVSPDTVYIPMLFRGPVGQPGSFFVGESMVEVRLKEGDRLEWAIKKFRREVQRSGILRDLRRRRFYVKPSEAKRLKAAAARRRRRRQIQRQRRNER
jgi:ribosomal protein S21